MQERMCVARDLFLKHDIPMEESEGDGDDCRDDAPHNLHERSGLPPYESTGHERESRQGRACYVRKYIPPSGATLSSQSPSGTVMATTTGSTSDVSSCN